MRAFSILGLLYWGMQRMLQKILTGQELLMQSMLTADVASQLLDNFDVVPIWYISVPYNDTISDNKWTWFWVQQKVNISPFFIQAHGIPNLLSHLFKTKNLTETSLYHIKVVLWLPLDLTRPDTKFNFFWYSLFVSYLGLFCLNELVMTRRISIVEVCKLCPGHW